MHVTACLESFGDQNQNEGDVLENSIFGKRREVRAESFGDQNPNAP